MLGAQREPITTGSVETPIEVARPLPRTLSLSDATRIGQTARSAFWKEGGDASEEWVNARTGSSGTLTAGRRSGSSAGCVPFSTTVTSLGGVHSYVGTLCSEEAARGVLRITEGSGEADT